MQRKSLHLFFVLLLSLMGGVNSVFAEEVTIASFVASTFHGGTTGGWTLNGTPTYATGGSGYYQLTSSSVGIVTPSITWSNYTDITITIGGRKYGGPNAIQGKISVRQGETELATYSPSGTSIVASSALSISPTDGTITICCPGASDGKGCGVQTITIKGTAAASDPSSAASFANATPSIDLKDAFTYTQIATTASGYSSTAGASVTYSITANTAGATIDDGTGEVTLTKAGSVTVQASAAAITGKFTASTATYTLTVSDTRVFTVTCHTGNTSNNVNRTSGATLDLDKPAAILGMDFVGWSSTNNAASPTWVSNSTKVSGNMDLYAIYEAVPAEYSYRLVESSQADWRGDYLIAYSSTVFADGRVGGKDDTGAIGKQGVSVDPGKKLSGKVVDVVWGDTYNVTIIAKDDDDLSKGYLMKTKDGKYNYNTSNSNGLSTTSEKATAAGYPLSITYNSSSDIDIAISAGAVFHYNTDGFFRFYKDGGQNNIYLYKKTVDVAQKYSLGITESATISGAGFATFVSDNDLIYSGVAGLKAYRATLSGTTITFEKVTTVPAGEGVLLQGDAGTYDIPVIAGVDAWNADDNMFVRGTGAAVASEVSGPKYNYILNKVGGVVGFYKAAGNTVATNRAYLQSTTNAARITLNFDDEETTGIVNLTPALSKGEGAIYDLQGRRITTPGKGLYIVNGKKVVIK